MRRAPALIWVVALLGLLAAACGSEAATTPGLGDGELHRFVIPPGTGEAIDRGELVEIVPLELRVAVGDSIEIVNNDDRGHNVGLFFVRSGETVTQTFRTEAEYTDACTVHPSGQFTIIVS